MTEEKRAYALGEKLHGWIICEEPMQAKRILVDAIAQATKPETIEWLAAIAERYGFKPPEQQ